MNFSLSEARGKKRDMDMQLMTLIIDGEEYSIKMQGTTEKPYFCGKDVCKVLGYADGKSHSIPNALQKFVKPKHKCMLRELVDHAINYNDGKATYITKTGFESLLMKSRTVKNPGTVQAIVDQCGLNLNHLIESKEQDTVGKIIQVFSDENYETQFRIGSYRIDLYFPDQKIAVECDEFGHADRDQSREKARQMYIENRLGCEFVRYNPDAKDFSIFKVIRKLVRLMTAIKDEKIAELTTSLADKEKE